MTTDRYATSPSTHVLGLTSTTIGMEQGPIEIWERLEAHLAAN